MHWVIKDVVISHSNEPTYEGRGFVFNGTRVIINEYESLYNLTLHVPSIDANNNTKIECLTMGDQTSQSKPAYLIVLGKFCFLCANFTHIHAHTHTHAHAHTHTDTHACTHTILFKNAIPCTIDDLIPHNCKITIASGQTDVSSKALSI